MLYNYLKISFRSILKHKLFSFVNLFGLAFSLSVCIIIALLLADQYSYDRYNTDKESIYRINHTRLNSDNSFSRMATSPLPLGEKLVTEYSGIKESVKLYRGFGNDWVDIGGNVNIPVSGFFADSGVLDFFQYELAYGDPEKALLAPYSVVITQETAERLFNVDNAIGQVIKVGDLGSYKVTGVLKETNNKSHIVFDALASISTVEPLVRLEALSLPISSWGSLSKGWTYIKLDENKSTEDVLTHLAKINKEQYADNEDIDVKFSLQNLTAITPGPLMGNQIGPGLPDMFMYFLIGLAAVIMLSTCFNYTNLSIARSMTRAKEVGVRKTFGANRAQVFAQFLTEAIMMSVLAFGFSLIIMQFLEPAFMSLNISQLLHLDLNNSLNVYTMCFAFSIFIGAVAGFFPSLFHSSVKPLQALKELSGVKLLSKTGLRKALIVTQFGLSLFFIITVLTINGQKQLMLNADYGMVTENIVNIRLNGSSVANLKNELLSHSEISSVAAASFAPATGTSSTKSIQLNIEDEPVAIKFFAVDDAYIPNMKLTLLAGRNFNENDTELKKRSEIVLNEKAVETFSFANANDAIGAQLILEEGELNVTVIGVVKDYNYEALVSKIDPMMLHYLPERYGILQAKLSSEDTEAGLLAIEASWKAVNPNLEIDYKFMDDEIHGFADMLFGDLVQIITFISMLALIMACLGLLGMAVFSTESRLKEISIRKVLGASEQSVLLLLSKGFLKLLLMAIVIMVPLAYLANDAWLQFIAYRVDLGVGIVTIGIVIVSIVGIITIGSQTFIASRTNPIQALRNEG